MPGGQEQLEIKFRLPDGSDIGPKKYPFSASVSTVKESILSLLPKDKENSSRTASDIKLIHCGKILENNKTIGECKNPILDASGGITTMHVVLRPPPLERGSEKQSSLQKETKCGCIIL
ncbi:membrane-anchored ubiquitin-fold protein 1-like [Wolffia australiana]